MHQKVLETLFENKSLLSEYHKRGFISDKIFLHIKIYKWVQKQIDRNGISKNRAVHLAMNKFGKSERSIWYILSRFS